MTYLIVKIFDRRRWGDGPIKHSARRYSINKTPTLDEMDAAARCLGYRLSNGPNEPSHLVCHVYKSPNRDGVGRIAGQFHNWNCVPV